MDESTEPVQVWLDVDRAIAPLVRALNRVPGVRTYSWIRGRSDGGLPYPYVMLDFLGSEQEQIDGIRRLLDAIGERVTSGWSYDAATGALFVEPERIVEVAAAVEALAEAERREGSGPTFHFEFEFESGPARRRRLVCLRCGWATAWGRKIRPHQAAWQQHVESGCTAAPGIHALLAEKEPTV